MPLGRPTIYSEDMVLKTQEYLSTCHDIEEDKENGIKAKVKIPTIEGLAVYLGIHKDTIYDWESIHPTFSDVIDKLRGIQADRLLNNGLAGTYNPTIAKVLLTKHGYREGTDMTSDGKAIKGNSINFTNFNDSDSK